MYRDLSIKQPSYRKNIILELTRLSEVKKKVPLYKITSPGVVIPTGRTLLVSELVFSCIYALICLNVTDNYIDWKQKYKYFVITLLESPFKRKE